MARRAHALRTAATDPLPRSRGTLIIAIAGLLACGGAVAAAPQPAKPVPGKSVRKAPEPPAVPPALPEQIDAAERVYYGTYECEFNQTVHIAKSSKHAAFVSLTSGKSTWLMKPVLSTTGAVRLEDVKGETLMVQIATKSMLLNVKTARRIVDDCISPRQRELIAEAKAAKAAEAARGSDKAANAADTAASAPQAPPPTSAPSAPLLTPSQPAAAASTETRH